MANVRPFRATYYQPGQADYARVLTPPYDVISPARQAEFYDADPYNFIRIDFGQSTNTDSPANNVYTRAAATLEQWLHEGVFTTDAQPAYYLHRQRFGHHGQSYTRQDLFVLCEATPFEAGDVLPHEKTLDGPKADRYALMTAAEAHLSPVFSVYQDPQQTLAKQIEQAIGEALFAFTDDEGIEHEVFAIAEPEAVTAISAFFEKRPLYIADGHHRYETAVAFRRAHYPAVEAAGYLCMYLSSIQDPGLLVLPYHRLIRARFEWPEQLLERAADYFQIEPVAQDHIESALASLPAGQMGIVMETAAGAWLLQRPVGLPEGFAADRAPAYRCLDVSVLHELLLYELAGFPATKSKDPDYIQFSPEISVLRQTLHSEGGVAFYLNHTPVSALCEIAEQGECMPPKSTYFYPKVPSGLLFTRFNTAF
ncbi:MAG: hypothetical protein CVV27_09110 [Candidatus Melainabacteria bacterium HGW-Melainabacteria-1]|nr:MAG: hypothetical protein CVV27_09110 [Candidatus Melainabacteria bacterium HGW-Melainabacteria-1]